MEKSSEKKIKKFTSKMQARLLLVFCIVTLILFGLMGRLVYIMQTDGDRYAKKVLSQQSYVSSVLPYKRGEILDRNQTVLAKSELEYKVIINPKDLLSDDHQNNLVPTINALKQCFGIDEASVQSILKDRSKSQYVILKKNVKKSAVDRFNALMKKVNAKSKDSQISSIYFEDEYVRKYPFDSLACDLIGFTSADNSGYFGMEEYYNDQLNGTNGRKYGYYDSSLNIERIVKKPQNGNSVVSTIDANAQRIIQKYILQFNKTTGSKNIGVLVMNPNTGEILAMASNKEYNLNTPRDLKDIYSAKKLDAMTDKQKFKALNKLWKNDAISYNYEPGSTFKPITVASALEEDVVKPNQTFVCKGRLKVAGRYIKCSHVHGTVTLGEALMKSCNVSMMEIAAKEKKKIFYEYENKFGIGKKTGIDLPGEEAGINFPYDNIGPMELATSSFGQGLKVTMVQMAAAFSSLVNGGNYYKPHIVKQIVSDTGATVKQYDPILVRKTVSEKTSEFIQKYMYQTVEEGTATGAKVKGYSIGGKTGTAEKIPRGDGKYLVSFLGCSPAVNPEVVIYVIIDEPKNVDRQDNSGIATKFAGEIMKELLPALGVYPDGKIDYLYPFTEDASDKDTPANKKDSKNAAKTPESTDTKNTVKDNTDSNNTKLNNVKTNNTKTNN